MAWIPATMMTVGTLMNISGGLGEMKSLKVGAARKMAEGEWNALEAERDAQTAIGISQLQAREQERQGQFIEDRIRVIAAAQGGGSDPSVVNLLGRAAGEKAYRAAVALYEGEDQSRSLRIKAQAIRYQATTEAAAMLDERKAKKRQIIGSTLMMGSSMFGRFGGMGGGTPGNTNFQMGTAGGPANSSSWNWMEFDA